MDTLLSEQTIASVAKLGIEVPLYNRNQLRPKMVHIGLGHFHRAHLCSYVHKLLQQGKTDWGIQEVDILPSRENFKQQLKDQNYLYSLTEKDSSGNNKTKIIGCILGYTNGSEEPNHVLDLLARKETDLVTLTITEKGYCYDDGTHSLQYLNEHIQHDLHTDSYPKTAIGFIAKALYLRKQSGIHGPTIISCDNIPKNGAVLKTCILQFCAIKYPDIVSYVEHDVAFPCTMVDRITPNSTTEDIERVSKVLGVRDNLAVVCEDYIQWVIEDHLVTRIPSFSVVGATVTKNVEPFELMKIRLLNGSHSALAYLSYLMGYRYVDAAVQDADVHNFIRNHYMLEVEQTLEAIPGIDFSAYMDQLLKRFSNSNIRDTILRLAEDGSTKIQNFVIPPLLHTLKEHKRNHAILFFLASWIRFLAGVDEQGNPIPLVDKTPETLRLAAKNALQSDYTSVLEVLGLDGLALQTKVEVTNTIDTYLKLINTFGVREALSSRN